VLGDLEKRRLLFRAYQPTEEDGKTLAGGGLALLLPPFKCPENEKICVRRVKIALLEASEMLRGVKSFEAGENNCQRLCAEVTETAGGDAGSPAEQMQRTSGCRRSHVR